MHNTHSPFVKLDFSKSYEQLCPDTIPDASNNSLASSIQPLNFIKIYQTVKNLEKMHHPLEPGSVTLKSRYQVWFSCLHFCQETV